MGMSICMFRCLPLCVVVRDDSARTWQTDRSVSDE